jgi:hypothetical protein
VEDDGGEGEGGVVAVKKCEYVPEFGDCEGPWCGMLIDTIIYSP